MGITLDQFIFIIAGVITIFFGVSGLGINSRKSQRLVRLIGEVPTRIFYIVLGLGLLYLAFFVDLTT
jgi:hypothetical protein